MYGGSSFLLPPDTPRTGPDDIPLRFRERFLAASGNDDRLAFPVARRAGLITDRATFDTVDHNHDGSITLEEVRRYVREGRGMIVSAR